MLTFTRTYHLWKLQFCLWSCLTQAGSIVCCSFLHRSHLLSLSNTMSIWALSSISTIWNGSALCLQLYHLTLSLGLLCRFEMQDTTGFIFKPTTRNTEEMISHGVNTWQMGIRDKQINSSLFLSPKDCLGIQFFKKLIVRWFCTTATKSWKA